MSFKVANIQVCSKSECWK